MLSNGLVALSGALVCQHQKYADINMGRGAIIVEEDLAEAVDNGTIAGAGIDVFIQEPIPENHPYLKMKHPERMRLTPHVAWASVEARTRLVAMMADNVRKGW